LELLRQGVAAARAGDKAQTRRLLRQATALDPGNEAAWLYLAGVAESALESIGFLERVLQLNPANEKAREGLKAARLQAGLDAVRAKDKPLARRLLTEAAQDQPNNEVVWLHLAAVADDPGTAINHLERVLQLNPGNERARTGIAYYRARLPQPTHSAWQCPLCQAPAEARQARCPRCGGVLTLDDLGAFTRNAAVDAAQLRTAVTRLTERLRQKPEHATAVNLGLAYLNLNQVEEAVAHFQAALKLKPEDRVLRSRVTTLVQHRAAQEQAERAAAPRRAVLIVDDSPTIRKVVAMTFEGAGHRVIAAGDSQEAVEALRAEGVPDLILLDITMPGMDGYQLCKLLRQSRETQRVPIVMLSGKDGLFSKLRGRMAGSTEYITKPCRPEALLGLLDKYCAAGRALATAGGARG
jgi:twitching motility two-component system response regulator PilG